MELTSAPRIAKPQLGPDTAPAIPPGYKQTEVGVIPGDWEPTLLPEAIWFQEGPGLRNWQFRSAGLKVINVTNLLDDGFLDLSTTDRHISWDEFDRSYQHFLVDEGDVVMASSGNSYCKTAVVRSIDLPLMMNTSVIRYKAKAKIDRDFMLAFLKSVNFKSQIDLMITGGAQPNFGPAHLKRVVLPLPPTLAEQQAIAAALGDADAYIDALAQRIAKQRLVKQGAMQELLTGKRRLPGFAGEWEVKRIGELGDVDPDSLDSRTSPDYTFKYISLEDVEVGTIKGWSEVVFSSAPSRARRKVRKGDVLVATVRPNLQSHCLIREAVANLVCSTGFAVIRCISELAEPEYVYAHFFASYIGSQIESLVVGSNYPAINSSDVKHLEIPVPPTLSEQTAIAAVLSDMDAEIEALAAKLAKARLVKQGMMQELLTGRVRLV